MKLKVIDISCGIENIDLKNWKPDKEGFALGLEIEIGTEGSDACDLFRFTLCDVKGLMNTIYLDRDYSNNGFVSLNGYNMVVIKDYSYQELVRIIDEIFNSIDTSNKSWHQVARQLNRYFYWEYQNEEDDRLLAKHSPFPKSASRWGRLRR